MRLPDIQVYGQQSRLQKYCKFFRKQHTIDKFNAVIDQLDEHSEKAWQLADTHSVPVRRRGMRSSFSQGLQRSSISTPADSVILDSADCPGSSLLCVQQLQLNRHCITSQSSPCLVAEVSRQAACCQAC